MGGWRWSKKSEADGLSKLAVTWLNQQDYFQGLKAGTVTWTRSSSGQKSQIEIIVSTIAPDPYIRLIYRRKYTDDREPRSFDYKHSLATTPCHFGGHRYWFICGLSRNGAYCGRRIGVLYLQGDYFGCRHCHQLSYTSRNENPMFRNPPFSTISLTDKADALLKQIKRPYYAGKPTRKQKRLERLLRRINQTGLSMLEAEHAIFSRLPRK